MKTYFCNNPLCKNHVDIRKIFDIKEFRHKYRNDVFLCDSCHNAVKMAEQILTQKKINIFYRQRDGQFAYVKSNLTKKD